MFSKLPESGFYIYDYLNRRDGNIPFHRVEISKEMFVSLGGDMHNNKQFRVVFTSDHGNKTVMYKHDFDYYLFEIRPEYFLD